MKRKYPNSERIFSCLAAAFLMMPTPGHPENAGRGTEALTRIVDIPMPELRSTSTIRAWMRE